MRHPNSGAPAHQTIRAEIGFGEIVNITIQITYWLSSSKKASRNISPAPAVIPTGRVNYRPPEASHV